MNRSRQPTLTDSPIGKPTPTGAHGTGERALRFLRDSYGATDVGAQRERNEDAFFVDDDAGLYLVCDGMGGHASGQIASEMAVRTVVEALLGGGTPPPGVEPLVAAIELANQNILSRAYADPSCAGMGTTVVGIRAENDLFHICHCGDSRCYLLRGGALQQVTEDHSLQNLYKKKPELAGRMGPAQSNVIVRAVGLEPILEVEHRVFAAEDGDLFLLCCDGLTDLVDDWMIQEIMTSGESLESMSQSLIRAANGNGGSDNITVILIQVSMSEVVGGPDDGRDPDKTLPGY